MDHLTWPDVVAIAIALVADFCLVLVILTLVTVLGGN